MPYLSARMLFSSLLLQHSRQRSVPELNSPSNLRPTHGHAQFHEIQRRHPPVAIAVALPFRRTRPLPTERGSRAFAVFSNCAVVLYIPALHPVPRGPSYLSGRVGIGVRARRGERHAAPLFVSQVMRVESRRYIVGACPNSQKGESGPPGLEDFMQGTWQAYTRLSPPYLISTWLRSLWGGSRRVITDFQRCASDVKLYKRAGTLDTASMSNKLDAFCE